ncbi:hypothetical protein [Solimonas marina]|uniref:Uncharacterized protein n=1 Tax=Solimonas marina TaxID=2714601 RepID=A0A969W8R8_9GAMM|nr:hypothetical protein [Solimonas marina]NKF21573.1 hypothetical protein [Solimonas marina]
MAKANNYGTLDVTFAPFTIAGAIDVVIPATEKVLLTDNQVRVQSFMHPSARERFFLFGDENGGHFVASDHFISGGSVTTKLDASSEAEARPHFTAGAAAHLVYELQGSVSLELRDYIADFAVAAERLNTTAQIAVHLLASPEARDLLTLVENLIVKTEASENSGDMVSIGDSLLTSVQQMLQAIDTAAVSERANGYVGALLGAGDGISVSDSLRYGLQARIVEAVLLAASAVRQAAIPFNAFDTLYANDNGTSSAVARFIARERFIVSNPLADSDAGRGEYRAPYYLWGDGRWTAYYGDGVSGRLDEKP